MNHPWGAGGPENEKVPTKTVYSQITRPRRILRTNSHTFPTNGWINKWFNKITKGKESDRYDLITTNVDTSMITTNVDD